MDKLREYNKHYYDLRHRKPTLYRESQYVLILTYSQNPKIEN